MAGEAARSEYRHIRIDHRGPISWVILDRPDKANALSNEMLEEFSRAFETLAREGGPVIGIRGEGKGFSSGYDLMEVGKLASSPDPLSDRERLQRNVNRYLALWDHPKPVIAAVHGYCAAGATQLCVFTDITVVADDAVISEPGIPIGGGYIAPLWTPLVGPKRAKELAFVPGNRISGRTAVEWGWANHSVPASELLSAVEGLAARIAKTPPGVLRMKKLAINRAAEAQGFRAAATSVAEVNALLHFAPEVVELRKWIAEVGLKKALDAFRTDATTPLIPADRHNSEG